MKGTLMPTLDSIMFNSPLGTIYGPYEEGSSMKIAKLLDVKMVSDSVRARHILLKIENGDTAKAMATADSLKNAIKKGSSFEMLAMTFSQDPGSGMKGGDLGWFRQGQMVPTFNDASFNGNVGDMPIVKSDFGVHLIEIMDKSKPTRQVKVGIVERKIEPSQKTFDAMYNKASEFASKNTTAEAFDSSIVKQGLSKRLADNLRESEKNVPGLDQPREMIRWAYTAEKGDISKVFTFGDKYVIAHLVDIKEKGFLPLESVKDQVTAEVRKTKKADMLIEKFNNAGGGSIDAVAQKLNVTATDAENVVFANGYIAGIGSEPKLVGTIFALKPNQLSKPVKGETGVSEVMVKKFNEPQATKDYSANMKQLADGIKQRSEYEVFNALKEEAGVEDYRGKFY
jgi:peptidyl-prolyl cis-trans isomerase D